MNDIVNPARLKAIFLDRIRPPFSILNTMSFTVQDKVVVVVKQEIDKKELEAKIWNYGIDLLKKELDSLDIIIKLVN